MQFDELAPVSQLTKRLIRHLSVLMESLPSDPIEIARVAVSNGENVRRLACCAKLFSLYSAAIPIISLTGDAPLSLDKHNRTFEKELTVSVSFPGDSLTTVFSCLLASIGRRAVHLFATSPSSPDGFAQCARAVFRYTWLLRCRRNALRALRERNRPSFVSHALRLSSFPDFDARAPRGAIFVALEIADRVDVAHLAHFLPLRTLTDATRTLYGELKEAMGKEQRETLEELELTVEDHLRRKETAVFFSSRTVAEDSLFLELLSPLNGRDRAILWENPLKGFVAFMLYEISPDRERDKFLSEFVSAGDKAARLKLDPPRRYELMHIEILTEPVPVKKPEPPKKPEPFPIANLFQPQRDFIADTKLLRK